MTLAEPILLLPPDHTRVWRYVDFPRFMSTLDRSSLWFTRLGLFEDSYEGTFSASSSLAMLADSARQLQMPYDEALDASLSILKALNIASRESAFANCWCGNEGESTALWGSYGQSVAIQSTIGRLKGAFSLNRSYDLRFGRVEYVEDPENEVTDNLHIMKAILTKQNAYDHEREIRAFFLKYPPEEYYDDLSRYEIPSGFYLNVDLNILIEKVIVAPKQSGWFKELVQSMMNWTAKRHGFPTKPVEWSRLRSKPVFGP